LDFLAEIAVGGRQVGEGNAVAEARRESALRVTDKSPPIRSHYRVFVNGEPVTETTSGALSPSLGYGIALAYLPPAYCDLGQEVQIEVRDRRFRAEVVKKPFLKKP